MSKLDDILGVQEQHESYGQISLSRVSVGGGGANLFGSSIKHGTVFSVTVYESSKRRKFNEDGAYVNKELICVDLSAAQLTEFMTSPNMGFGVPCTIRRFNGEGRAPCPEVSHRQLIDEELKEDLSELMESSVQLIERASEICSQKTIKKSEQAELISALERLRTEIECNLPFVQKQFNRSMDKVVKEAKSEIEVFFDSKVEQLGIQAIRDKLADLLLPADDVLKLEQE